MRKFWGRDSRQQRDRQEAGQVLWRQLRDRQLAGCRFRRQHPIAGYVADFACIEAGLVVEVERPAAPERREYDRRRSEILDVAGYRVLRFACLDVVTDIEGVLARIAAEVGRGTLATPVAVSPLRAR